MTATRSAACSTTRLGLIERCGRSESANDEPRVFATSALTVTPIHRRRVRLPHVCIEPCYLETRREDADDLGRNAVEHDGRADRILRTPETRLPEVMTDEDQPLPLFGFFRRKAASQRGLDAEECKQVGGDAAADDLFCPFCS